MAEATPVPVAYHNISFAKNGRDAMHVPVAVISIGFVVGVKFAMNYPASSVFGITTIFPSSPTAYCFSASASL